MHPAPALSHISTWPRGPILVSRALSRIPSLAAPSNSQGESQNPSSSTFRSRVTNQDSQSSPRLGQYPRAAAYHPQSPGQYPRATAITHNRRSVSKSRRPSSTTARSVSKTLSPAPRLAGSVSKTLYPSTVSDSVSRTQRPSSAITGPASKTHYPSPTAASSTLRDAPPCFQSRLFSNQNPC